MVVAFAYWRRETRSALRFLPASLSPVVAAWNLKPSLIPTPQPVARRSQSRCRPRKELVTRVFPAIAVSPDGAARRVRRATRAEFDSCTCARSRQPRE